MVGQDVDPPTAQALVDQRLQVGVLVLPALAEKELELLVHHLGLDQLMARDLERQRRQMLAAEIGRDVGRGEREVAVAKVHKVSIYLWVAGSYARPRLSQTLTTTPTQVPPRSLGCLIGCGPVRRRREIYVSGIPAQPSGTTVAPPIPR